MDYKKKYIKYKLKYLNKKKNIGGSSETSNPMESTSTDYSTPEKDKKKPLQTPKTDKVGDAPAATPPMSTKTVNPETLKKPPQK